MKSLIKDKKLKPYDELFSVSDSEKRDIQQIPLEQLHRFKNHPFKVIDDAEMESLVESIQINGVMCPLIARLIPNGGYELIAGHRRKRACELAGLKEAPVLVMEMTDDQATIFMVDTNLQREKLLPSEKAFAYKMRIDAMKHQGLRTDLTSAQLGQKLTTRDIVAAEVGESKNQVSRYIRLTELNRTLLEQVDEGKVAFNTGVELTYLTAEEQECVLSVMEKLNVVPTLEQATRLKQYSQEQKLDENVIHITLSEEKKPKSKVVLPKKILRKYFPENYSTAEIEKTIYELLEQWKATLVQDEQENNNHR